MNEEQSLTDLINQGLAGNLAASEAAFAATYQDLHRQAHLRLNRTARGTMLDTTALVHESYLRFVKSGQIRIEDRHHFLRYAAQAMRSVIVDAVRKRAAVRHGGGLNQIEFTTNVRDQGNTGESEILAVHDALEELAKHNQRMVQVVEMRYFAGMTDGEVAEALKISDRTVRRTWERARVWLAAALQV